VKAARFDERTSVFRGKIAMSESPCRITKQFCRRRIEGVRNMNEVIKAISERYTCRDFKPEPLDTATVEALVEAALAAPSAMNLQPWHIIVVTDKAFIDEMDAAAMEFVKKDADWYKRMTDRGGKIFYNAPCMIFIAKDILSETNYPPLDCGIVTQNIALAAHSLGLGSCICGMARIPLDKNSCEKADDFRSRLKFPEAYDFGMSVCVGKINSGKAPHEIDKNKVTYIN